MSSPSPADAAAAASPASPSSSSDVAAAASPASASASAPAAASAASAAAAASSPRYVPNVVEVVVDEDPVMTEQIKDEAVKAKEIAEFRAQLKEHNEQFKQQSLVRDMESSDRVCWRFLQARKWDVPKAVALFKEAVAVRESKALDTLLDRPCVKGLEYKVVSKHGWHGFDRFGRPVFVKNTGWQDFPALYSTGSLAERVDYNTYVNEWLRQRIMPDANARAKLADGSKPLIDHVVTIVNLQNFGWHCIKQHNYSWVKEIAAGNNVLYPESAGTTVIINAPRIFSMVWGIVKGWLDERTRAKVQILSGDGSAVLKETLGLECYAALPKVVGGECVCMPDESAVPKFGMGCMLGHAQSVRFIKHLQARNDAAGIANSYSPPAHLVDQAEAHLESPAEAAVLAAEGLDGHGKPEDHVGNPEHAASPSPSPAAAPTADSSSSAAASSSSDAAGASVDDVQVALEATAIKSE